jgi:hypothetical protein
MQIHTPGIVVDYRDNAWVIEDEATGVVARTTDPSAIYGLVTGGGWPARDDDEPTGTRDSGDEDPHAD